MSDQFADYLSDPKAILGAVVLALLAILTGVFLIRRIVSVVKSEKPDEPLSNLGMVVGLGWSSEAVWMLTGEDSADLILPLRIALFAIFEMLLIVFMIRAKRNMKEHGNPGRSGTYAWIVAGGMSLVAVSVAHNIGEGILRLLVPLLLLLMWWDGLVGETPRKSGSFKWTPRNLLIALGAIEADERDVREVNRDRLISQMVTCHRRWANAKDGSARRDRLEARLTRLSEKADDTVIAEVRERRARSGWFTTAQLAQEPSAQDLAHLAHLLAQQSAHGLAHLGGAQKPAVEMPPARRAKPPAQGATSKNEALAQAAQKLLDNPSLSSRAVAREAGVPDSSLRDLVKKLRAEDTSRAPESAQSAHKPINGRPVLAGTGTTREEN